MTDRPDWRITLQADHIKRLEEENEKLRTARHLIEISRDKWEYRAKNLEKQIDNYFIVSQKYDKLKQSLRKIQAMLQVIIETNNVYPLLNNLNKILDKISEASDDMENN